MQRLARLAAQKMKDALDIDALHAKNETLKEAATGSPQTPGYEADYGQSMKPTPQWSAAREPAPTDAFDGPQNHEPDTDIDR